MHPVRTLSKSLLCLSLLGFLSLASAQTKTSSPRQNTAASIAQSSAASSAVPSLTQIESLQLQNLQLKSALLQQQFQQLQTQLGALADHLTQEHPGWRFDPRTQSFLRAVPASTRKTEGRK